VKAVFMPDFSQVIMLISRAASMYFMEGKASTLALLADGLAWEL
jgi:hypothetical protein